LIGEDGCSLLGKHNILHNTSKAELAWTKEDHHQSWQYVLQILTIIQLLFLKNKDI
jgi:hypothetical protein